MICKHGFIFIENNEQDFKKNRYNVGIKVCEKELNIVSIIISEFLNEKILCSNCYFDIYDVYGKSVCHARAKLQYQWFSDKNRNKL